MDLTWWVSLGLLILAGFILRVGGRILYTWIWYGASPFGTIDDAAVERRSAWMRLLRPSITDRSTVPPATLHSLDEARSAACAALGLGPDWSAEGATPLGVLLKETPVTIPQLRTRLLSLYGRDIGDVDEATPVGAIASAIYLPSRTGAS